jgi:hypothetical protein
MASHLDPDVLAGFREGLLSKRRSARIRAHLGTCPACASLDKDLAQVTELLASAPAPRMPDHLAARLENVLAAEAAARAANPDLASQGPEAADAASPAAGRPDRPRRTGRRSWQLRPATLGAAAAVAAVLAVGGYGLANLQSGAGNNAASSGAAGPAHGSAGTMAPNARSWPKAGPAEPSGPAARVRVIQSGTDYLPGRLASQAQAVLASHPLSASIRNQAPQATSGSAGQLQSCAGVVAGGLSPLLVDKARYQGRPATIIVRPATADRAGQVWVTRPTCSAGNPGLIAHAQLTTG